MIKLATTILTAALALFAFLNIAPTAEAFVYVSGRVYTTIDNQKVYLNDVKLQLIEPAGTEIDPRCAYSSDPNNQTNKNITMTSHPSSYQTPIGGTNQCRGLFAVTTDRSSNVEDNIYCFQDLPQITSKGYMPGDIVSSPSNGWWNSVMINNSSNSPTSASLANYSFPNVKSYINDNGIHQSAYCGIVNCSPKVGTTQRVIHIQNSPPAGIPDNIKVGYYKLVRYETQQDQFGQWASTTPATANARTPDILQPSNTFTPIMDIAATGNFNNVFYSSEIEWVPLTAQCNDDCTGNPNFCQTATDGCTVCNPQSNKCEKPPSSPSPNPSPNPPQCQGACNLKDTNPNNGCFVGTSPRDCVCVPIGAGDQGSCIPCPLFTDVSTGANKCDPQSNWFYQLDLKTDKIRPGPIPAANAAAQGQSGSSFNGYQVYISEDRNFASSSRVSKANINTDQIIQRTGSLPNPVPINIDKNLTGFIPHSGGGLATPLQSKQYYLMLFNGQQKCNESLTGPFTPTLTCQPPPQCNSACDVRNANSCEGATSPDKRINCPVCVPTTPGGTNGTCRLPTPPTCGQECRPTNPCPSGLVCTSTSTGKTYCSDPNKQALCSANPSESSCCKLSCGSTCTKTEDCTGVKDASGNSCEVCLPSSGDNKTCQTCPTGTVYNPATKTCVETPKCSASCASNPNFCQTTTDGCTFCEPTTKTCQPPPPPQCNSKCDVRNPDSCKDATSPDKKIKCPICEPISSDSNEGTCQPEPGCKCGPMTFAPSIFPGQLVRFTATSDIKGADTQTWYQKYIVFQFYEYIAGSDSRLNIITSEQIIPSKVIDTPNLVRYQANWDLRIPFSVKPVSKYRVEAFIGRNPSNGEKICLQKTQAQISTRILSGAVLGTTSCPYWKLVCEAIASTCSFAPWLPSCQAYRKESPTAPPTGGSTLPQPSGQQNLQLRTLKPAKITAEGCNLVEFQFEDLN